MTLQEIKTAVDNGLRVLLIEGIGEVTLSQFIEANTQEGVTVPSEMDEIKRLQVGEDAIPVAVRGGMTWIKRIR